jgi:ribonuclease G
MRAMQNEILINASPGETRIAIVEKGQFVELHIERASGRSVVGNVIKGRVTRVLPGMQAAFVEIGLEKAAFLYAGDYLEDLDFSALDLGEDEEPVRTRRPRGRNGNGRSPGKIESLLREGQEIVVQVAKEPIGTKGARITSHVSIAGRHLVLTPWSQRVGVSRRIDSDRERRRLREIVGRLRPRDLGFIIRTAGEGIREADLEADIRYLTAVWDEIQLRKEEVRAPARLYSEPSLPIRAIRDFTNGDTRRIVVDSREVFEQMQEFVTRFVAEPKPRIEHYRGSDPIFDHFAIEAQIDQNLGRKVWLKSGGYLIIDQSEALTAIDVNTGRYVGRHDLEQTVLKTNLEAAKEAIHQLRFRNIGGLIIIDLIDMESAENREKVFRALQDAARQDKAKTNVLKISELGLIEMTRKRTRENLVQTVCEPCAHCDGRGYMLSRESVAYKVLREVRKDLPRFCGQHVALAVNRRVAEQLLGPEKESLAALEQELGRQIEVRARPELHQEQFEVTAIGEGPPIDLEVPWLSGRTSSTEEAAPGETEERGEKPEGWESGAALEPIATPEAGTGIPSGEESEAEDAGPVASSGPETTPAGIEDVEPAAPEPPERASQEPGPGEPGDNAESAIVTSAQPVDDEAEYRILPRTRDPEEG